MKPHHSSQVTPPLLTSPPSLPVDSTETPFEMRLQQHSLIHLGNWAAGTDLWPRDQPRSPIAWLYQSM